MHLKSYVELDVIRMGLDQMLGFQWMSPPIECDRLTGIDAPINQLEFLLKNGTNQLLGHLMNLLKISRVWLVHGMLGQHS